MEPKIIKLTNSNHDHKEISLYEIKDGWEITTATETESLYAASGTKYSISRKKFNDYESAEKSFSKRIKINSNRGWIKK